MRGLMGGRRLGKEDSRGYNGGLGGDGGGRGRRSSTRLRQRAGSDGRGGAAEKVILGYFLLPLVPCSSSPPSSSSFLSCFCFCSRRPVFVLLRL
eukprot:4174730-Pyramimonas_sp.AAC.1